MINIKHSTELRVPRKAISPASNIRSKSAAVLLASWLLLSSSSASVFAQSEYWQHEEREASQKLSSAALNLLVKQHQTKKGSKPVKGKGASIDQAIVLLNKAIIKDPTDPLPHYLLGVSLGITGKYEEALDALKKAYDLEKNEPEILVASALTQHVAGNYKRAVNLLDKRLATASNKGPLHACIGFSLMRLGKFDDALDEFDKAKEVSPSLQLAYQGMAFTYYLAGDFKLARKAADHALSLGEYPPLLVLLARMDYMEGNPQSAQQHMKAFEREVKKAPVHRSMTSVGFSSQHDFLWDPFNTDFFDSAYSMRARYSFTPSEFKKRVGYATRGKSAEAILKAEKRLQTCQDDYYIMYERGLLELSLGSFQTASDTFQKVLQLNPSCQVAMIDLSYCLFKLRRDADAASCIKHYKKRYPTQELAETYETLATIPNTAKPAPTSAPDSKNVPLLPGEGGKKPSSPDADEQSPF